MSIQGSASLDVQILRKPALFESLLWWSRRWGKVPQLSGVTSPARLGNLGQFQDNCHGHRIRQSVRCEVDCRSSKVTILLHFSYPSPLLAHGSGVLTESCSTGRWLVGTTNELFPRQDTLRQSLSRQLYQRSARDDCQCFSKILGLGC